MKPHLYLSSEHTELSHRKLPIKKHHILQQTDYNINRIYNASQTHLEIITIQRHFDQTLTRIPPRARQILCTGPTQLPPMHTPSKFQAAHP